MRSSDRGRIPLPAFLYLAMVCFVSPKEPSEGPQQQSPPQHQGLNSAAGSGGRRLFVRGRGDDAAAAAAGGGESPVAEDHREDLDCAATDGYGSPVAIFSPPHRPTPGDPRASRTAAVGDGGGGSSSLFGNGLVAAEAGEGGSTTPASVSCAHLFQRLATQSML